MSSHRSAFYHTLGKGATHAVLPRIAIWHPVGLVAILVELIHVHKISVQRQNDQLSLEVVRHASYTAATGAHVQRVHQLVYFMVDGAEDIVAIPVRAEEIHKFLIVPLHEWCGVEQWNIARIREILYSSANLDGLDAVPS